MIDLRDLRTLIGLTKSEQIARRYFVTNGFDASLAMLGLVMGFRAAEGATPDVALTACFGTSVALAVSAFVSTYASESAELRRELHELTGAMLDRMSDSAHRRAANRVPGFVAMVSGASPFVVAQVIMLPLWLERSGLRAPLSAVDLSIGLALLVIFLFGALLGHVGRGGRIAAGLRLLAVGAVTAIVIGLVAP